MAEVASRPGGMLGMRHVALFVHDLEACVKFYRDVVGMQQNGCRIRTTFT